jgi:hypothetical protein
MHCGEDFDSPVDADSGQAIDRPNRRLATDSNESASESSTGAGVVGILLALIALVTLPIVSPPNVTFFYLIAVVGIGFYASKQPTTRAAIASGGQVLAFTPIALWGLAILSNGLGILSAGSVVGAIVYAVIISTVTQWAD